MKCCFAVDTASLTFTGLCLCVLWTLPRANVIWKFLYNRRDFLCPAVSSSRLYSHNWAFSLYFWSAVLQRSVLLLPFRSLSNQEAKSPFHASTEYKPGPQVQRGASSGLFGTSDCKTLQRYKNTLPWPIHSLLETGTERHLLICGMNV